MNKVIIAVTALSLVITANVAARENPWDPTIENLPKACKKGELPITKYAMLAIGNQMGDSSNHFIFDKLNFHSKSGWVVATAVTSPTVKSLVLERKSCIR